MYGLGHGVKQDYAESVKWFRLAASRYPASEKELHDKAIRNRDALAAQMTPAQIAQTQKLAREWKPK
jgi:TPR repeat protein